MKNKTIKIIGGKVFTPSGARKATVIIKDGLISEITGDSVEIPDAEVIDAKGMNVVPGGIDIHIHGGGGHEFIEGTEEAFRTAVQAHAYYGMTSILPTLPACPASTMTESVRICENSCPIRIHLFSDCILKARTSIRKGRSHYS